MTTMPLPLASTELLAHARAAARVDEGRHSVTIRAGRPRQGNEQTLRGWGGAALLDLEWSSQYLYSKAEKDAYRAVYAAAYQRCRALRAATSAAPPAGTA